MDSISLSAGIRSNLNALQSSAALLARTQTRLGSGKKVLSAIDNPANYFTSLSLDNRAADLGSRSDGIAKGIMTVKAADTGIRGITSLLKQAKGVATDARALATDDTDGRSALMAQFNDLLDQIDSLAKDSGYDGVNLLANDSLTVEFAEKAGSSSIDLNGFDATSNGSILTVAHQEPGSWSAGLTSITAETGPGYDNDSALTSYIGYLNSSLGAGFGNIESLLPQRDDSRFSLAADLSTWATSNGREGLTYSAWYSATFYDDVDDNAPTQYINELNSSLNAGLPSLQTSMSQWNCSSVEVVQRLSSWATESNRGGKSYNNWYSDSYKSLSNNGSIDSAIGTIETSIQNLSTKSNEISSDLGVLTARQSFTDSMVDILNAGSADLTNADMNEESANLLALNTQQSLGTNSLSLAAQASSSILQLLR